MYLIKLRGAIVANTYFSRRSKGPLLRALPRPGKACTEHASDAPKPAGKGAPTFFAHSQITKLAGFDGNAKSSVLIQFSSWIVGSVLLSGKEKSLLS